MENLWLYLVETTRAIKEQNLTTRLRVNELADIAQQEFAAVYTGLKPTWSGVQRATHECNVECVSSFCGLDDAVCVCCLSGRIRGSAVPVGRFPLGKGAPPRIPL